MFLGHPVAGAFDVDGLNIVGHMLQMIGLKLPEPPMPSTGVVSLRLANS